MKKNLLNLVDNQKKLNIPHIFDLKRKQRLFGWVQTVSRFNLKREVTALEHIPIGKRLEYICSLKLPTDADGMLKSMFIKQLALEVLYDSKAIDFIKKNEFDIHNRMVNLQIKTAQATEHQFSIPKILPDSELDKLLNKFVKDIEEYEKINKNKLIKLFREIMTLDNKTYISEINLSIVFRCIMLTLIHCYLTKNNTEVYAMQYLANYLLAFRIANIRKNKGVALESKEEEIKLMVNEMLEYNALNQPTLETGKLFEFKTKAMQLAGLLLEIASTATELFTFPKGFQQREENTENKYGFVIEFSSLFKVQKNELSDLVAGYTIQHMLCPPICFFEDYAGGLLNNHNSVYSHYYEKKDVLVRETKHTTSGDIRVIFVEPRTLIKTRPDFIAYIEKNNPLLYNIIRYLQNVPYKFNHQIVDALLYVIKSQKLILDNFVTQAKINDLEATLHLLGGKLSSQELDEHIYKKLQKSALNIEEKAIREPFLKRYTLGKKLKYLKQCLFNQQEILNDVMPLSQVRYLFTPYDMDAVGRIYSIVYFNHQGAEWIRALYEFSEKYIVDLTDEKNWYNLYKRGCEYIREVAPNLNKTEINEIYEKLFKKIETFENITDKLEKINYVMSAPCNAKKPFLALHWFYEVSRWKTAVAEDKNTIESNYINWLDAHASACSHIVQMIKDTQWLPYLGLYLPTEEPIYYVEDISGNKKVPDYYQEVTNKIITRLKEQLDNNSDYFDDLEKETIDSLKYFLGDNPEGIIHLNRSILKKCIMGYSYSMTKDGMANSLREYVNENESAFKSNQELYSKFTTTFYYQFAKILHPIIEEILPKQKKFMKDLQFIGKLLSRSQNKIKWRSILGLFTEQFYYKEKKVKINLQGSIRKSDGSLRSFRKRIIIRVLVSVKGKADEIKQDIEANKRAIAANIVHGKDAEAFALTTIRYFSYIPEKLQKLMIEPFNRFPPLLGVHDSFGVPIPLTDYLCKIYAEVLEDIYAERDVMNEFIQHNEDALSKIELSPEEKNTIEEIKAFYKDNVSKIPKIRVIPEIAIR